MINAEKYKKEIKEVIKTNSRLAAKKGKIHPCRGLECRDCDFWRIDADGNRIDCVHISNEWMITEYEPPRLENGTGLEQGQIIEVSQNCKVWIKGEYISFYKGKFVVVYIEEAGVTPSAWKYARLLED